jgi:molybdopterin converting factor small subunit
VAFRLPVALRRLAGDQRIIEVECVANDCGEVAVRAALAALAVPYPGIHHAVLNELGTIRPHVNLFVGVENIRFREGQATLIPPGVEVSILPAVSGG